MSTTAYAYEAAIHCPTCAAKRFRDWATRAMLVAHKLDENGVCSLAVDREGNPPHPLTRGETAETHCDTCRAPLQA